MAAEKERWLPVVGYEGRYEVSDLGRVRSLLRAAPKVLKTRISPNGYEVLNLGLGNRQYVHRLVASAFLPGSEGDTVNHINGTKSDNRAMNLEWHTYAENTEHAYRVLGRTSTYKPRAVLVNGVRFESQAQAAKHLGAPPASVRNALRLGRTCRGATVEIAP